MEQRRTISTLLRWTLLSFCALWAARWTYLVSLRKSFTLDEFQWAHAAWEVANGRVPFRDFFEVHFPLNYQYMSLAFRLGDANDPTQILTMRMMMLPLLALMAWGMWQANRRDGPALALLSPILAFTLPSWVSRATEIRHDPLAFALFMGAIGFLYLRRGPVKLRAAASGLLLALACWGTQKVLVYGVVFLGAGVTDLLINRPKGCDCLLGDPIAFLLGFGAVGLTIAGWLRLHDVWEPFYQWCFAWAADYQVKQTPFSWFKKLMPMLRYAWWYFGLTGIGIAITLRRLRDESDHADPDQVLLLAWLSTWASWALQQAPWSYSAIPFIAVSCVFAGRGAAGVLAFADQHEARGGSRFVMTLPLTLLFLAALTRNGDQLEGEIHPLDRHEYAELEARYFDEEEQNLLGLPNSGEGLEFETEETQEVEERQEAPDTEEVDERPKWERFFDKPEWAELDEPQNEYQLRVLAKVGELTDPNDAVYDNTGTFVARPHAYWFYYTFRSIWTYHSEMLIDEVPQALEESGAVMMLIDSRYGALPKPLRKHIQAHYQPYNGDIFMAGQYFKPRGKVDRAQKAKFTAVVEGDYFVYPPTALSEARLRIDGKRPSSQVFSLGRGEHRVTFRSSAQAFYILWRPRNGELWHPNPNAEPRFCCRKTTG
jgi:hypothetical protein